MEYGCGFENVIVAAPCEIDMHPHLHKNILIVCNALNIWARHLYQFIMSCAV